MKRIFLFVLLSCPFFAAEELEKSGMIILLNGTSAAGKSSLVKELQKQSENGFFVISFDDFISKYDKEVFTIAQRDDDFYQYIKDSSKLYDKVLVDTVDHEDVFERYDDLLGEGLIKILVYCPLQDMLKRVERRNHQSQYENEHLKLFLAFTQFSSLYKSQSEPDEPVIDRIHASTIKIILREIKRELDEFDVKYPELDPGYLPRSIQERAEKYNKLVQDTAAQFNYNRSRRISLTPKLQHYWDFVINSGTNSPAAAARKIADFLESKE